MIEYNQSDYLHFISLGALFISIVSLFHTLGYKGMAIFPNYDATLPTQFWILAIYCFKHISDF